jgi:hypothetical protein
MKRVDAQGALWSTGALGTRSRIIITHVLKIRSRQPLLVVQIINVDQSGQSHYCSAQHDVFG